MLVDGMFVESELVECRAHPLIGGVVRDQIEMEDGEPLMLAMVGLLQSVHDASSQIDDGSSPNPNGRCRQN
jgi:hypothetical protein